jgi:hypothetical protein
MEAVAGPGVASAERFEDDNGLSEFAREVERAIEREIPAETAKRDHPVEDIVAGVADGVLVESLDSNFGDWQRALRA